MRDKKKYDPEDIESLMMHKPFDELYDEEKNFVLQHLESKEEYESMQNTLRDVQRSMHNEPWLDPEPQIKSELMALFAKEDKRGFNVWLNSLFAMPQVRWYRQPALRYALAVVVIAAGSVFFITQDGTKKLLSENVVPPEHKQTQEPPTQVDSDKKLQLEHLENSEKENVPTLSTQKWVGTSENSVDETVSIAESETATEDMQAIAPVTDKVPQFENTNAAANAPVATSDSYTWSATSKDQLKMTDTSSYLFSDDVDLSPGNMAVIEDVQVTSTYSHENKRIAAKSIAEESGLKSEKSKSIGVPSSTTANLLDLLYTAL